MEATNASTSGNVVTRLSRSPSASSLISEESFDHKATTSNVKHPPIDGQSEKKSVLGVRDLIHMARDEKEKKTILRSGLESPVSVAPMEIQLFGGTIRSDDGGHDESESPLEGYSVSANTETGGDASEVICSSEGPFARDVEIKGWKIVGGRTWTGAARVGSYVGKSGWTR